MTKKVLVLTLVVAAGGACGGGQAGKSDGGGDGGADSGPTMTYLTGTLTASLPEADILFVIDDWASTTIQQQKLLVQIPTFMQVLQALPLGLPSLHVAVISADMGADTGATNPGCSATGGDDGVFKSAAQAPCIASTLQADATFITDDANGTTKNFTAPDPMGISTVFQCIGVLGGAGCGFPQPLAAAARALGADGQPPPSQNAGFLRDDAALAIILLTNQDDCSVPAGSDFFTDSSTKVSDPLGPLGHYRCNEFGHLCNGVAPPRLSPDPNDLTTAVTLDNCVSNESGMLTPVASVAAEIKALKSDPSRVLAAAITAPAVPYTVMWQPPPSGADTQPWPTVESSCTSANGDGTFGDPSVRTAQWIAAFGDNGVLASVCDNSYASSMAAIASKIGALAQTNCLTTPVEPDSDGQPECTLSAHMVESGITTDKVVPSCVASGNTAPCWTLTVGATSCPDGATFTISSDPNHPNPTALSFSYTCVAATPTP
jgi:hypothetical protein